MQNEGHTASLFADFFAFFSAHASLRDHAILTCKKITSMSQNTFECNYKRLYVRMLSSHILCSISMLTYYYTYSSSPREWRLNPRGLSLSSASSER